MTRHTHEQSRQGNRPPCPGCEQLQRRVGQLEGKVHQLTEQLQAAQRSGKRQAAPFAKGKPNADPKKPGRKAGKDYGPKAHRPVPTPDQIDEVYEAPLPSACPDCGGQVAPTGVDQQYQVEIPRKPIHRQFNVHIGRCTSCDQRVQGRHELQSSDALGAACSQLGAEAQAAMVDLNKTSGLSHGKVKRVMQGMFGIEVSRSTSAKVMLRAAQRCEPTYQTMVDAMPAQPWVVGDETGWRIGGLGAWLHTLVAEQMTCYAIEMTRGAEIPAGMLGWDYQGVLIHDGWAPYDRFVEAEHQTCLAHLLRRCEGLLELANGAALVFPQQVKTLLRDALALRDRRDGISAHGLAVARGRLNQRLDRLLHWTRANPDNERLAAHLAKHHDQLFTFLDHREIDATNWRAEQAIRPAVVNRKVWGPNRTERGARAQSVLMSVLRTCVQQGKDAVTFLSQTLRGQPPPLVPVPLAECFPPQQTR